MLYQFKVATLRPFSFSLPKSSFFPNRFEFVGIDIGIKHNMSAKSKHALLRTWPKPRDICAVAAFIAFSMFYQKWILYYDVKVKVLMLITNTSHLYNNMTKELWPQETEDDWQFVILAVTSNPFLVRWDSCKRWYVKTDLCQIGMRFVCMNPGNDDVLMAVMIC